MIADREWYRRLMRGRWLCVFEDSDRAQVRHWIRPRKLDRSRHIVTADRQY